MGAAAQLYIRTTPGKSTVEYGSGMSGIVDGLEDVMMG